MKRPVRIIATLLLVALLAAAGYGALGYRDALRQSEVFAARADAAIARGMGPSDLGAERLRQLLLVQDPGYFRHDGIDLSTDGAGLTTLTQSVAKRLGFAEFRPGLGKLRQTGFALGLERRLTKAQILALFLETVEMGQGPDGWMTGFFHASERVYGRPPAALSDRDYFRLLAVMIAPGRFRLLGEDAALDVRQDRIGRLVSGRCRPSGHGDVWLEGCAVP